MNYDKCYAMKYDKCCAMNYQLTEIMTDKDDLNRLIHRPCGYDELQRICPLH